MEPFANSAELHQHRTAALADLPEDKRAVIDSIEKAAFGRRQTQIENIYGTAEYPLWGHLRDSVALHLKHHPKVQLSTQQIAAYLHCSEEEIVQCIQRAEIEIVERSGSPASEDFMIIGRQLGVVISELVRTFA